MVNTLVKIGQIREVITVEKKGQTRVVNTLVKMWQIRIVFTVVKKG